MDNEKLDRAVAKIIGADIKAYSTDRSSTWDVINWMLQRDKEIVLRHELDDSWHVSFSLGSGRGRTPMEAICRAVLTIG